MLHHEVACHVAVCVRRPNWMILVVVEDDVAVALVDQPQELAAVRRTD